jgi:hypothetical protein
VGLLMLKPYYVSYLSGRTGFLRKSSHTPRRQPSSDFPDPMTRKAHQRDVSL